MRGPGTLTGENVRVQVSGAGAERREVVQIRDGGNWVDALDSHGSVLQIKASQQAACMVESTDRVGPKIVVKGRCGNGTFERDLELGPGPDMISVKVRLVPGANASAVAVEDRLTFAPEPRRVNEGATGPLDFIWSQNIKSMPDDVVAHWAFKSPVVMFQQGRVFAAIVPRVDLLTAESLTKTPAALDLDVTSGDRAWFSYGAVSTKPIGHSYFRRVSDTPLDTSSGAVEYSYWIVASAQPARLGYRRITHLLWDQFGGPTLRNSTDLQRNVVKPELFFFEDWRHEAWARYAGEKYWDFDCGGGQRCGAITSNRNPWGKWDDAPKHDAWFNSWFQNLRTAYGWDVYARRTGNTAMRQKAEAVLNLILRSPRQGGAFSTIYLGDTKKWLHDDGWAGNSSDYHTFCMSWTGYWMLRWADDLVPERKAEILAFLRPYADFLLKVQEASGVIPSWFDEHLRPRPDFRDFNAETAGSALFLAKMSADANNPNYLKAAVRAQDFIAHEVIPRQRWYDFETFLSCARKPFAFYDRWTAQYPANNLSTIQAAMADMELFNATKDREYLDAGTEVVDYLLLTQQVWNHPLLKPKMVGGTTTQNTDAEWSDARECYFATLLLDYYLQTGSREYLERAVAAARSSFTVAPWENWAHNGFNNEHGSLTGFHWSTGSEMASVEMMTNVLGDAYINGALSQGVGFDACTVRNVGVSGGKITFGLEVAKRDASKADAGKPSRDLVIHFSGLDPNFIYTLVVNDRDVGSSSGKELLTHGYSLHL